MKKLASYFLIAVFLLLGVLSAISSQADPVMLSDSTGGWREGYAYSMGIAAINYAYPWLRMAEVRHRWAVALKFLKVSKHLWPVPF
jgi:hypothetical protein